MSALDETSMGLLYINESFTDNHSIHNLDSVSNGAINMFYVTFDTNLQDFDVMNRNRRYYDRSNIEECIKTEKIQSMLRTGGWFGEFDHPTEEEDGRPLSPKRIRNVPPDFRAFKIMNPTFVGNTLKAKIQSAQSDRGISFGKEVLAGWIPQFSCRAIATMVNRGGKPYVIVRLLITYDAPWYPSHEIAHATSTPVATVTKISTGSKADYTVESVADNIIAGVKKTPTDVVHGITIPITEILHDVGVKDVNAQIIMESFDLDESCLVGFNATHDKIIMKDENNTIYANINPESVRMVNDFYSSF